MKLIIDAQYLCHRAWHSTGNLSFKRVRTGIIFGVMREASLLDQLYEPEAVAWCFDSRKSLRKEIFPGYKTDRTHDRRVSDLIKEIREDYLPSLGYRNVFVKPGYEADDIIASLAEDIHFADEAVIVGADKDLWQCLSGVVSMYNPVTKKVVTAASFREVWGIYPSDWRRVKAIAGCPGDCVPGIKGIGEKSAALWVQGKLTGNKKDKIEAKLDIATRNLDLVALPFPGCPKFEWKKDRVNRKRWRKLADRLGMRTLRDYAPRRK